MVDRPMPVMWCTRCLVSPAATAERTRASRSRVTAAHSLSIRSASSRPTGELVELDPEVSDRRRARARLLELLDEKVGDTKELVDKLVALDPEVRDLARARSRVLDMIDTASPWKMLELADALVALAPEASDLARARASVLAHLDHAYPYERTLMDVLTLLRPTVGDLTGWVSWPVVPCQELLAAVRRNTPLESWLELMPALEGLPLGPEES
jgi:hypothetical protein